MKRNLSVMSVVIAASLGACTYANVSTTPVLLADGAEGYRYTGRANFQHQLDEADLVMQQTCAALGLRPLIVEQGNRNIGAGVMLNGGYATALANQQQDIIFKCVS